jgi:hypothetical protein
MVTGMSLRFENVALSWRSWTSTPPGLSTEPLVHLGLGARPLLRGEGASFLGEFGVALDRGAAYPEGAGGFGLGHASTEGFDDLLPEVF